MRQFDRVIQVFDLQTYKALFPMAAPARPVSGRAIPRSRCDDLIVLYLAGLDLQPMPQTAARGIDQSVSFSLVFCLRFDIGRLTKVLNKLRYILSHILKENDRAMESRELS